MTLTINTINNFVKYRREISEKLGYIARCFYKWGCVRDTSAELSNGTWIHVTTKLQADDLVGLENIDLDPDILTNSNEEIDKIVKAKVDDLIERFNKNRNRMRAKQLKNDKLKLLNQKTQIENTLSNINKELEELDNQA